MSKVDTPPAAFALWRLRRYVTASATAVGLALAAQLFVWSMVTFTEARYDVVEPEAAEPAIVIFAQEERPGPKMVAVPGVVEPPEAAEPEPVRVRNACDRIFDDMTGIALGSGTIAVFVLLMLVGITAILMSSAGLPGVDQVVSAWIWTILVAVLALPLHELLHLPWPASALRTYDEITAATDAETVDVTIVVQQSLCIVGSFLLLVRFRAGVGRSIPPHPYALDPHLEKEAANIKVTTLYGGRSAAALKTVMGEPTDDAAAAPEAPQKGHHAEKAEKSPRHERTAREMPAASALSPGERPRRII